MSNPILLTRTNATFPRDVKSLRRAQPTGLLLSGKGPGPTEEGHRYFFDMLSDREWWQSVASLGIGQSVAVDMDPVVINALKVAARMAAGRDLPIVSSDTQKEVRGDPAVPSKLGEWLLTQAGRAVRDDGLKPDELRYFVSSGGSASNSLKALLGQNFPGRRFRTLVDVGCGIGFIPFLLTLDPRLAIESATLIEPAARYCKQGSSLWMEGGTSAAAHWQKTTGEGYSFDSPAELITSRQCLFRIAPAALPAVFERAWTALRQGGLLVVCEMLTDDPAPTKPDNLAAPLVQRIVLLDLLSRFGKVRLHLARNRWSDPFDPYSVSAKDYRSDSFLVIDKPA
jgi:hypothetical protein